MKETWTLEMILAINLKHSVDNGKYGGGVFLDLQKAFDTMNHDILLQNAPKWFHSYLTGRARYVTVKGHVSGSLPVPYDVPQGSVLGQRLFLIYVNDLLSVSKVLRLYLFEDDTSIYYGSDNLIKLQKENALKHQ